VQPTEFTKDMWGKILRHPTGYWYFVPSRLPPVLELSWELVGILSEADRSLSELAGVARSLPNPQLLLGPLVRREAVLSSRIEGTEASLSDLFFYEAARPAPRIATDAMPSDVHEVANYVQALEYGLERLSQLPLSLRLIREMHARLMDGVRGEHKTPGEFRRSQNWIGPPGCSLADATFVPPPVAEMKGALNDFERFLHARSPMPPLVWLAVVHYQFEAIHPFLDGNGRIGRLLIPLMMSQKELLTLPLLSLSAFFERRRQDYYQLLTGVSQRGAWSDWIRFFLSGVAQQSRDAIRRTDALLDLRHSYRKILTSARSSALSLKLVDDLFEYPVVTVSQAARRLGITHRSASQNIRKLIAAGVLEETTGQRRYRVFVARTILRIIEEDEPHTE